jgi:thymidylate synthase (FAD)
MIIQEDDTDYCLGDQVGFSRVEQVCGSDLVVVNSARVSYGGESERLEDRDKKLISYLAKNEHTSPFRHCFMTFHVKAPEFVARQWYKHIVGCNFSTGDSISHGWNEISGRYVEYEPEFYFPYELRKQSKNSKQASEESEGMEAELEKLEEATWDSYDTYKDLLRAGVAKEQARMVLPFNTYTEFYWTASLQAIAHFCKLRNHEHAQYEIQQYANSIEKDAKYWFPYSFPALIGETND